MQSVSVMSSDGPPLKGQFDGILPGNPEEAVKQPGHWLNMLFEKGSDEEQQSFSAPSRSLLDFIKQVKTCPNGLSVGH